MAPVKAPPPRGLDDGGLLRYGADLKSAAPATVGRGSRFMEWIGNRHEVSLKVAGVADGKGNVKRSEEHTSELQSLMRISYAVFCLKKKKEKTSEAELKYK